MIDGGIDIVARQVKKGSPEMLICQFIIIGSGFSLFSIIVIYLGKANIAFFFLSTNNLSCFCKNHSCTCWLTLR